MSPSARVEILLTGGSGQVGAEVLRLAPAGLDSVAPSRAALDMADPDSIARISIMTQAPGAFFCYGVLMAGCIWLEGKLDARIERKSCCDIDNLKKEG